MTNNMVKIRYALSIDGGGIRGIIPAMILAEIEKRTKRRIADIFYSMAGSSTGGFILAGLNHNGTPKYSAEQMVNFFKQHGPHIFADRDRDRTGAEYSDKYLNSVLDDYFKDEKFYDSARRIVITSYDIYNNESFIFNSWTENSRYMQVKDAVRATLAVPTLFLPNVIEAPAHNVKEGVYSKLFVSGSLVTNNPAAYAYAAARHWWPEAEHVVLSLGTGRTDMYITSHEAKNWTGKDWIKPLRQIMFSSNQGINNLLSSMLESNFIRIQGSASSRASETDDASEANIKALEQEAMNTIEEHEEVIDKFCKSVAGYHGGDI